MAAYQGRLAEERRGDELQSSQRLAQKWASLFFGFLPLARNLLKSARILSNQWGHNGRQSES